MGDRRSSPPFSLRPCRSSTSHNRAAEAEPPIIGKAAAKERPFAASDTRGGLGRRKGWILRPMKKERRGISKASSSSSFSGGEREEEEDGRCLEELGLPLGISFAAVVAQVWDEKKIPADRLSTICVTAVKKAVADVHGKRYEYFLGNFEKSFCSTMKTLQFTRGESFRERENLSRPSSSSSRSESVSFLEGPETSDCVEEVRENQTQCAEEFIEEIHLNQQPPQTSKRAEGVQDNQSSNQDRQMILTSESNNQQLMSISDGSSQVLSQAILTTFEKLAVEQARSNELKAFKLGLTCQRMKMKETEISLSSESNALEQKKLSVGLREAQFKEDKLKAQMKNLKQADFVGRCIDLLVAGLFLMSMFLGYAAWVYSYRRIIEATEACIPPPKGGSSYSWFIPKQLSSLNNGFLHLRCHAVVVSRMSFGILLILVVAYSLFQRSASPGSTMPVTFILLILGGICGVAGKLCIDTLGGDGYKWLMHWETLCLLHFIANAFPSLMHPILYGQVYDHQKPRFNLLPYWLRRLVFFGTLLLVLPTLGGLLPFAPVNEWKDHFTELLLMQMRVGEP